MGSLKYLLKYKIQIKFCDKFKSVRYVLCNYYVVCHHPEIMKNVCLYDGINILVDKVIYCSMSLKRLSVWFVPSTVVLI